MQEETVTVREFLRNYKKFTAKKKPLIVTSNGKAKIVVIAYKEWEKKKKKRKFDLKDIEKISFKSGDFNLRKKIDEIVYGYPNPHRNDTA